MKSRKLVFCLNCSTPRILSRATSPCICLAYDLPDDGEWYVIDWSVCKNQLTSFNVHNVAICSAVNKQTQENSAR